MTLVSGKSHLDKRQPEWSVMMTNSNNYSKMRMKNDFKSMSTGTALLHFD